MAKKSVPAPSADVLPYLRAALGKLRRHQRENSRYDFDAVAAPYLLEQLHKHGLAIVSTMPAAAPPPGKKKPTRRPPAPAPVGKTPPPVTDPREPRIIEYTTAESNRLLKEALRAAFPKVKFLTRASPYGSTTVYYMGDGSAPALAAVQAVAKRFCGQETDNCDSRGYINHRREGPDGYPEIVYYGTGLLSVDRVVTTGPVSYRTDGNTHINSLWPLSLRASLLKK